MPQLETPPFCEFWLQAWLSRRRLLEHSLNFLIAEPLLHHLELQFPQLPCQAHNFPALISLCFLNCTHVHVSMPQVWLLPNFGIGVCCMVSFHNAIITQFVFLCHFKGARTYCIINKATPSGVVAMDYFSQIKAVLTALPHPQHYLA